MCLALVELLRTGSGGVGLRYRRILVTGGAGFIGSHLCEKLVSRKYEVVVLDNFSSGLVDNLRNVHGEVELIRGDIRDRAIVDQLVGGVDAVVHLAAMVDVRDSVENPLVHHEVNAAGTLNLLESARKGLKGFVYASSCAVYGEPLHLPLGEDHPVSPLSPYAASKLAGEGYCRAYSASYGLRTTVLRFFNVYGSRQSGRQYSGVISEFIGRVKSNQPPVVFGDGEQTRDFIYVGDVVEYVVRALERDIDGIFNVGSGISVSINDLAELVLSVMGEEQYGPLHAEAKVGEIRHSRADISWAVEKFEYSPFYSLEAGLRAMIGGA